MDAAGAEDLEAVEDSREGVTTEAMTAAIILLGGGIEAATGAEHEDIHHIRSSGVIDNGLVLIPERSRLSNGWPCSLRRNGYFHFYEDLYTYTLIFSGRKGFEKCQKLATWISSSFSS